MEINTSSKVIKAIKSAMTPERRDTGRCTMGLTPHSDGRSLTMRLVATDLTSLRAALNTNLRLIATSINTIKTLKKTKPEKDSIK